MQCDHKPMTRRSPAVLFVHILDFYLRLYSPALVRSQADDQSTKPHVVPGNKNTFPLLQPPFTTSACRSRMSRCTILDHGLTKAQNRLCRAISPSYFHTEPRSRDLRPATFVNLGHALVEKKVNTDGRRPSRLCNENYEAIIRRFHSMQVQAASLGDGARGRRTAIRRTA